jgi:hypothetical protein
VSEVAISGEFLIKIEASVNVYGKKLHDVFRGIFCNSAQVALSGLRPLKTLN